jgi:hypothetical protein
MVLLFRGTSGWSATCCNPHTASAHCNRARIYLPAFPSATTLFLDLPASHLAVCVAAVQVRAMLAVPYFEKALYELPEDQLTPDTLLALADEIEVCEVACCAVVCCAVP